jgi:hypothetical protein
VMYNSGRYLGVETSRGFGGVHGEKEHFDADWLRVEPSSIFR